MASTTATLNTVVFIKRFVFYERDNPICELAPAHFQDSQPHSRLTRAELMDPHWTASCLPRHIM